MITSKSVETLHIFDYEPGNSTRYRIGVSFLGNKRETMRLMVNGHDEEGGRFAVMPTSWVRCSELMDRLKLNKADALVIMVLLEALGVSVYWTATHPIIETHLELAIEKARKSIGDGSALGVQDAESVH